MLQPPAGVGGFPPPFPGGLPGIPMSAMEVDEDEC